MLKRWLKRTAVFIGLIAILLMAFVLFLHTAAGKSLVRQKLESFLQKKWGTQVSIGNLDYRLPNWLMLENVIVLDRARDTLLNGGRIYVAVKMLKLLSNVVDVSGLRLENIDLHCRRKAGEPAFNFQFILDSFAPAQKAESSKANETPLRFSVNQLALHHIRLTFNDSHEQVHLSASLGELTVRPEALYPEKSSFRLHSFLLRNSRVILVDSSAEKNVSTMPADTVGGSSSLVLALHDLKLQNVYFAFRFTSSKTDYAFRVDSLALQQASLDLHRRRAGARSISLLNTEVNLNSWQPAGEAAPKQPSERTTTENKWSFDVQSIHLDNNKFSYRNNALPESKGLDFQHIHLEGISLRTSENQFDSSGFTSNVTSLSLDYNNCLQVKNLNTSIRFSDSLLLLKNFRTAINQSQITTSGELVLPLKPGMQRPDRRFMIQNSSISFGDLLLLDPALKKSVPLSLLAADKIMLSGSFFSRGQNLRGEQIRLFTSNGQFLFRGGAALQVKQGGPQFSASLQELKMKKELLSKEFRQQIQKKGILLPREISLTGEARADANAYRARLELNSEFGRLLIDGKAQNINSPQRIAYGVTLNAANFNPGKCFGPGSQLGKINGQISVEGKGIEKNLTATARMQLQSAMLNGYLYSNINLQARMSQSAYTIQARINDHNLQSDLDLNGTIVNGFSVGGNIRIQHADLLKLGLTKDSVVCAGNIAVQGNYESPYRFDAYIQLDSSQVFAGGKQIEASPVSVSCRTGTDTLFMAVQAPFADVQWSGNYPARVLPAEFNTIWRKLYPFTGSGHAEKSHQNTSGHDTQFDARITQDALIKLFLPELELQQPLTVHGRFPLQQDDSIPSLLVSAPSVKYKDYEAEDLQLTAGAADSGTALSLQASRFIWNNKQLGNAMIAGRMKKDSLLVKAIVNDSLGKEFYAAYVQVQKDDSETSFRLLDDLTLNYNKWKISPGNHLHILREGYIINDLAMENRGQVVRIHTREEQALAPIDIKVENFDIGNFFNLVSPGNPLRAKGSLDADISIQQPIRKIPVLTGEIRAASLDVLDIPLGSLQFHSGNVGDSIAVQGELSGANRLGFKGRMNASNGGIALQVHLEKFNTGILAALTKDFLSQASGKITGDLNLTGPPDSLQYQGFVSIDSAAFALKALNTVYRINGQKLFFDYPALRFEKFALTDSAGHPLTVQGTVNLFEPVKKSIDLNIGTTGFIALQTARRPGTQLYGTAILDAALQVKGTLDEPSIEGNAGLQGKSNLHVVSTPRKKYTRSRKDGIIFVKMDTLSSDVAGIAEAEEDSIAAAAPVKGLKYNLALKLDKDAEFSILVNPSTGDELVMKGEGRLNLGLGKNGTTGIEGVYNMQSGYYKMNNLLLRGKFLLVKGSSISFNGDPGQAEADVTTEYTVEASPKRLLNYKDEENSDYSQRVPFAVVLMIRGTIAKPVLSFDIQLKQGKAVLKSTVKSDIEHALDRLRSDATEMNKQVFSLLLAKQFASTTADNTLESSNLNANNALKEGVSSFLTQAMDQVADQLIKNVDVDVSMKTYKTENDPVSKTDLGVAMSKDLLEDRLVIRIEESFAMGDQSAYPVKSGSQYVPDITSTYKLSKDGRFLLKAYQKNEYDAVVQGYFTEVGVSFTIELSYDKFRELVQRRKAQSGENK